MGIVCLTPVRHVNSRSYSWLLFITIFPEEKSRICADILCNACGDTYAKFQCNLSFQYAEWKIFIFYTSGWSNMEICTVYMTPHEFVISEQKKP